MVSVGLGRLKRDDFRLVHSQRLLEIGLALAVRPRLVERGPTGRLTLTDHGLAVLAALLPQLRAP
jgi:hypothetical protein